MRLINTHTRELEEFFESQIPPYAILSHCWGKNEVTYKEYVKRRGELERAGSQGTEKINGLLELAQRDAQDYVWIDTCCIDKRSSAELSEAINSMFKWYKDAEVCYAYLADVSHTSDSTSITQIVESRWFTRGWTLQELIAPQKLLFFDRGWNRIATREMAAEQIWTKTGIDIDLLRDGRSDPSHGLHAYSVAQRMSWAANRQTSRLEDRAYSLLGLFDVNMPLLYGEGSKAFMRLQHEIMKQVVEFSILAWSPLPSAGHDRGSRLLAKSPDEFLDCRTLILAEESIDGARTEGEMIPSSRGIRITASVLEAVGGRLLLLGCRSSDDVTTTAALKLDSASRGRFRYTAKPGKHQLAMCERGWIQHDGDSDLTFVDTLDAASKSSLEDVELRSRPKTLAERGIPTVLWVRFKNPDIRSIWRIIDLYPVQYWDAQNCTFDLFRAHKDAGPAVDSANLSEGESIRRSPVFGAIALKIGSTEMSIYFCQRSKSPESDIVFGIAPYDKKDFQQIETKLQDPQHRYACGVNGIVDLELHNRVIGGSAVAHLAVDVFESRANAKKLAVSTKLPTALRW